MEIYEISQDNRLFWDLQFILWLLLVNSLVQICFKFLFCFECLAALCSFFFWSHAALLKGALATLELSVSIITFLSFIKFFGSWELWMSTLFIQIQYFWEYMWGFKKVFFFFKKKNCDFFWIRNRLEFLKETLFMDNKITR